MGKKLPKSPSDLWKVKKTFMAPAEMHRHMRAAVEELSAQTQLPTERKPNGKTMRDFRRK